MDQFIEFKLAVQAQLKKTSLADLRKMVDAL